MKAASALILAVVFCVGATAPAQANQHHHKHHHKARKADPAECNPTCWRIPAGGNPPESWSQIEGKCLQEQSGKPAAAREPANYCHQLRLAGEAREPAERAEKEAHERERIAREAAERAEAERIIETGKNPREGATL
jgi:hypothetical protein